MSFLRCDPGSSGHNTRSDSSVINEARLGWKTWTTFAARFHSTVRHVCRQTDPFVPYRRPNSRFASNGESIQIICNKMFVYCIAILKTEAR